MVNAISSGVPQVTANNNINSREKVNQEQLYSPGLYTAADVFEPSHPKKKEGGFLHFLFNAATTAVVVGGAAAIARKTALKETKVDVKPEKIIEQAKYYTAKLGDYVNEKIIGKIFKSKAKAPDAAETGAEKP